MLSPATAFAVPLWAVETSDPVSDARGHSSGYREGRKRTTKLREHALSYIVLGTFGQHLGLSAQASQLCLRAK